MDMNLLNTTISSPEADFIAAINNASFQLTRYCSIFIYIFGTIGNVLNVIVLAHSTFRTSPCAQLFLFASVANLCAIVSGLTSRILSGWNADLTATNSLFCKLRGFIVNTSRPVAIWYLLFAIIDRWLLSNLALRYRQMSSLKNARCAMIISLVVAVVLFSHVIYCHEPYQNNAPQKCYGTTLACRFVTDLLFMSLSILPLIPMLIFGLLTIYNIRLSRSRTAPRGTSQTGLSAPLPPNNQRRLQQVDRNLLTMLLVQILILSFLSIPLGAQKVYSSITSNGSTSKIQFAIDTLTYNIAQLMHFMSNGVPFYIYTLAGGNAFRKVLVKTLMSVKDKVCQR